MEEGWKKTCLIVIGLKISLVVFWGLQKICGNPHLELAGVVFKHTRAYWDTQPKASCGFIFEGD